uniref:Strictosidine synthase conserved region domain-containing protein n=1 Tax=Nelumbo nucifera TaxID=4432 RepID=A0A822YYZ2_NELNU|nr:TPA_asm: hypothetical protein HUJ06_007342 [Nelumbo nucifera]
MGSQFLFFCFLFTLRLQLLMGSQFNHYSRLQLPAGTTGPESLAFDCRGEGPYVGISDGRIIKWNGFVWTNYVITSRFRRNYICDGSNDPRLENICGRPLGLQFNMKTCDLYVADAYYGLIVVGPEQKIPMQLATSAEGIPFYFTNGLDIDQRMGIVYFTDSSTKYQRRDYAGSILSGDKTGRLMRYDPRNREVTVLLTGLAFANGVAISDDGSFVLVTETGTGRILRFWLQGGRAMTSDLFIQLPGQPDNIKTNARGEFWVAVNPFEGGPRFMPNTSSMSITNSQAMRINKYGIVLEVFTGTNGNALAAVSEAQERNENLWIGSVVFSYVGVYRV